MIRDQLDFAAGDPVIAELVTEETSELTDYLHFFELWLIWNRRGDSRRPMCGPRSVTISTA